MIKAQYPNDCKLVVCGDFPRPTDTETFFEGKPGQALQKMLYSTGLSRDQVGLTGVVREPVGFNYELFKATYYESVKVGRTKLLLPTGLLNMARATLRDELLQVKPNVVLACGEEALFSLCSLHGLTTVRGSLLASTLVPGLKVVPCLHPSDILDRFQWQELFIACEIVRRKIVPNLNAPELVYVPWIQEIAPTIDDFNRFIREVNGPFTLDIETRGNGIACVGLCYFDGTTDRAMCLPLQTTREPFYSLADEWAFWRGLQWLLDRWPIVGHNVLYDLDWLIDYGMQPRDVHDTMLLWHRCYPELPKGLDFVGMWLTDVPYYKDDGKTWGYAKPDEQLWEYNIKDVVVTHRAWRALDTLSRTKFPQARDLYENYTRPLLPVAFEMQLGGMSVDDDSLLIAKAVLMAELDKIRLRLAALSDGRLVISGSNKKITDQQVKSYLYGTLQLPEKINRKTKAVTADEDALVELLIQFPDLEVLKAINAERKFAKALNSYINISWRSDAGANS